MSFTKKELILLFFLLFVAIFLRFYGLSDQELIKDEWAILFPRHDAMMNSIKDFVLIPTEDHWNKVVGYDYTTDYVKYHFNSGTQSATTPLAWWLISFSLIFFGENILGARLIPLIFNLFSILLVYFIVRKIYSKKYALLSFVLLPFYLFYFNMLRAGQSLEPFVLFFFLAALYCFLFYKGLNGRIFWIIFFSLMFFSNFPKAAILAWIFLLWELQRLISTKKFKFKNLAVICSFYFMAIIPSIVWALVRAKAYSLNSLWFLGHVFARGSQEQFRFLEVLYSYNSTKQGALLIIPAIYGLFLFIKSVYRKKDIDTKENLNLLWLLMLVLIPFLFLLSKQAGAWSHAMTSIPITIFSVAGIFGLYQHIKFGRYLPYLLIFSAGWLYVFVTKKMGDLITFVPRNDLDALTLYKSTFLQILSSFDFILEIFLLTVFLLFIVLCFKYKLLSDGFLKKTLNYSLFFSLVAFILHTFTLVVFGAV